MALRTDLRALVFDAYGTLFDPFSVRSLAEELFPGRADALSKRWREKQLEYSWLRTLMQRHHDFWGVTEDALVFSCRSLGLSLDQKKKQALLDAYLTLPAFPEVKGALEALSRYPLCILSNGTPEMLSAVVSANGLSQRFAHLFSVEPLGFYKPRPEVYQQVVERLDLPKEAIGFVSSNFWDIAGASYFGFRTFWLNRWSATPDELGVSPSATLSSLSDLPALLK